ncbi:PilX N-terminal domain-containing pilus assembly protein [Curvibacter sp. RS43]|uniref:pilus assembly PilX family protein n=1 Tax=Curvibacter microcysteis TaxID=3026419 RepID=UPI00235F6CDC|nr:PilX N-terminal domain-containing pilus assembly protein [Curvibacter sp. RS43]MDD0809887.1 PilX N-terminal domain-containing pilus assembly protein [Curvibacter sp. RS43]
MHALPRSLRQPPERPRQGGASLVVVLLLLVVVSLLGIGGIQIATMAERTTRNDRDLQIAWQGAEAALMDAEFDIDTESVSSITGTRRALFSDKPDLTNFIADCGTTGNQKGLCAYVEGDRPNWLTVDFLATSNTKYVTYGDFTSASGSARPFSVGKGLQAALKPRYVVEAIPDPRDAEVEKPADRRYVYRVTAMGFGPNSTTQGVLQMIYRD